MEQQKALEEQRFDDWPAVIAAIFALCMAGALVYAAANDLLRDEIAPHLQDRLIQE